VTGGLSGTGLAAAGWLASRGAKRIVLASDEALPSRRQWDETTDETARQRIDGIRALEARGVTVRVMRLDVTSPREVAALHDLDALDLPPIAGVVHTAAEIPTAEAGLRLGDLAGAMRVAAGGAWTLHQHFPPGAVDFLVLLAAGGFLAGQPGQAAAAAFLDALAAGRLAEPSGHTVSIGWDTCLGLPDMAPVWDHAARLGAPSVTVLRPDPQDQSPLLREAIQADVAEDAEPGLDGQPQSLAGMAPQELHDYLVAEVGSQIAAEMKLPAADLNPRRSLAEQGLDSVMTLKVRRRLEKRFGQSLPTTLLWQKPTVTGIAGHLAEALAAASPDAGQDAAPQTAAENAPVVVG
jgi:6-methylsalicylic acid synthase